METYFKYRKHNGQKFIAILLSTLIIFSACTPANISTPILTSIPPTAISFPPTQTATPRPSLTVKQDTSLFSGPGDADFEIISSLKAGDTLYPTAVFGDFVQVAASVNGEDQTGYVWKEALESPVTDLQVLNPDQIPLKPLYLADCSPGTYDAAEDTVLFTNSSDGYYDTESSAIPLDAPLQVKISNIKTEGAAIKILGIPEPVNNAWWKGITRLDLGYNNGKYYIGIRDGGTENYKVYEELPITADQGIQLIFDQPFGKSFRILDGSGKKIDEIDLTARGDLNLPNGLFPNGSVYIGTTMPPLSTFTVSGLKIGVQPSGMWLDAANGYYTHPGLADLAEKHNFTIGTEFGIGMASDPRYCKTMKREFNVAVLSDFSWPGMWQGPGQYDFNAADQAVAYALQHGWKVRASHLLWGAPETLPDWLKNGHYSRDEYIQLMQQYIKDVVTRYKGRVSEWSIANEASNRDFYPGSDFWFDKIGPEYIEIAFRTAREADPSGILIFNNDNNQSPQDADTTRVINSMYDTVKKLKADGAPLDVVGMQMHLFLPWNSRVRPEKEAVIATMQKFSALGVRTYITEFDIDLQQQKGTTAEKLEFEAQVYKDMVEACIESSVCDSFTTWEFSDVNSWIVCTDNDWCVKDANGAPLMFDANYIPKPAYFAVRDALLNDFTIVPTPKP